MNFFNKIRITLLLVVLAVFFSGQVFAQEKSSELEESNQTSTSNNITLDNTSNGVTELGNAAEDYNKILAENAELKKQLDEQLKLDAKKDKRLKNSYIYGTVLNALPGVALISVGLIEMSLDMVDRDSFQQGIQFMTYGGIALVGMEVTYQCGHWCFKWW